MKKNFKKRVLSLTLIAFIAESAMGLEWKFENENAFSKSFIKEIYKAFPEVSTPRELNQLLKFISRKQPLSYIYSQPQNGKLILFLQKANIINSVEFETQTFQMQNLLRITTSSFIGQPDFIETKNRLDGTIITTLQEKGYHNAELRKTTLIQKNKTAISYFISEGEPCIIDKVNIFFKIPEDADFEIKPGTLCDYSIINSKLEELEEFLEEENFQNRNLSQPIFIFNEDKTRASLELKGNIGRKVHYEITDDRPGSFGSFLFGDEILRSESYQLVDPENMEAELKKRYQKLGYIDARIVESDFKRISDYEFSYSFKVKTGQEYHIENVKIEGLSAFTYEEAYELLYLSSISSYKPLYDPEKISEGIENLKSAYQNKGFWQVKIRDPAVIKSQSSNSVRLIFTVEEKDQRILSNVNIYGNRVLSKDKILEIIKLPILKPLDQKQLISIEQDLKRNLVTKGYIYSQIKVDLIAKPAIDNRVPITINIFVKENNRVKFGNTSVIGLAKTDSKVIYRELRYNSGDWYNPEKIKSTRKALLNLGLFRAVDIISADPTALQAQEEIIDIIIKIREGDSGTITFGPGYNLVEGGRFNSELSYSNIGGQARRFTVRGEINEQQHQKAINNRTLMGRKVSFSYLEPYLLDYPVDGQITLRNEAKVSPQNTALWEIDYSGELSLTHKFRDFLDGLSLGGYYGQKVTIEEGTSLQKDYLITTGNVRIGEFGLRLFWDNRNSRAWPTEGYLFQSELGKADYSFGGDLKYQKWSYLANYYKGLSTDFSLAFSLSMTSYLNVQRKGDAINILPASERLNAGGISTGSVRVYKYASLGPFIRYPGVNEQDGSTTVEKRTLGGSRRTIFRSELRYRVTEEIGLSGFLDGGNVFLSSEEINNYRAGLEASTPQDAAFEPTIEDNVSYSQLDLLTNPKLFFTKHALSYGLAFYWLTPIGSASVSCGYPLHIPESQNCSGDPSYCFNRSKTNQHWYLNYDCNLDIGTRF